MRRSQVLLGNLNKPHWDRRPWEVGYRGPPGGKRKVTGKPYAIVKEHQVALERSRLEREWNVMRWLSSPYLNKDQLKPYHEIHGSFVGEQASLKKRTEQSRMPGNPKILNEKGEPCKAYANYGNLLHKSRTVEDCMSHLIRRTRWD